jgi:hypothetical protein
MTIDPALCASGLLLTIFPADRLLSQWVRLRSFDCFHTLERSPEHRPWWWVPALWLDPLRGFAGAWLLKASLGAPRADWAALPKDAYALIVAALGAGVVSQLFTRRDSEALLAPLGFVVGIVAALTPWAVAALGVAVALIAMCAFRRFHAFFTAGFIALAALGLALRAPGAWLVAALIVVALPLAVSAMTGRALEIPTRATAT